MHATPSNIKHSVFPGLFVTGSLALCSYLIANMPIISHTGLSSLVIAIVFGMIIGNSWHHPARYVPGIQFSAKRLLRLAIILYGFRISFQQIASLGLSAIILDTLVVTLTLLIGFIVGYKVLKLDKHMALLISAGAAICGAAAVLAVEDVIKSEPYKAVIAVGTVVLFGTISMFLYPFLQHLDVFHFSDYQFGMFAGASVHEVAQAMVAGANISSETGDIAVIVKMMRVLLLVPVLLILSIFFAPANKANSGKLTKVNIPWFAIGFVLIVGLNSLHLLPAQQIASINLIDTILLTMAMGAIGIETKFSKFRYVGLKPLYLALFLFFWLFAGTTFLVGFIG